ncbi:MAG: Ribosomal RNA small subunit methyltransferase D [Alphaproteobacteria bacterium MarineAlpha2_Bin1]|nr:MAG: Ribosomal RNA small subunit methyltransferase D [Alphaproteobacteria bacterium MarineAlpha2_Bin1]|tara:strand:- start:103 stop:669 length:567 start_codon:yes stop_codon:yes gene_type:complete
MQLRITGGYLKGKKIIHRKNISVRPTSSKVRQSIFNRIINNHILNTPLSESHFRFTDIFSGSGIIGFEALSRNFKTVNIFENSEVLINSIYKNACKLKIQDRMTLFCTDARLPPKAKEISDIIYIDPPYNAEISIPTILAFEKRGWISENTIIFVETSIKEDLIIPGSYNYIDSRNYGITKISTIKKV